MNPLPGSMAQIMDRVSIEFDVPVSILKGDGRHKRFWQARAAFYYLAMQTGKWSSKQIGYAINRDRTTVMYGVERAETLMEFDPDYRAKIKKLRAN